MEYFRFEKRKHNKYWYFLVVNNFRKETLWRCFSLNNKLPSVDGYVLKDVKTFT